MKKMFIKAAATLVAFLFCTLVHETDAVAQGVTGIVEFAVTGVTPGGVYTAGSDSIHLYWDPSQFPDSNVCMAVSLFDTRSSTEYSSGEQFVVCATKNTGHYSFIVPVSLGDLSYGMLNGNNCYYCEVSFSHTMPGDSIYYAYGYSDTFSIVTELLSDTGMHPSFTTDHDVFCHSLGDTFTVHLVNTTTLMDTTNIKYVWEWAADGPTSYHVGKNLSEVNFYVGSGYVYVYSFIKLTVIDTVTGATRWFYHPVTIDNIQLPKLGFSRIRDIDSGLVGLYADTISVCPADLDSGVLAIRNSLGYVVSTQWHLGDGTELAGPVGVWSTAGLTILEMTDFYGCISRDSMYVKIDSLCTLSSSHVHIGVNGTTRCVGDTWNNFLIQDLSGSRNLRSTYTWDFGPGFIADSPYYWIYPDSFSRIHTISYYSPGLKNVTLTERGPDGTILSRDSVTLNVLAGPSITVTPSSLTIGCGDTSTLTMTATTPCRFSWGYWRPSDLDGGVDGPIFRTGESTTIFPTAQDSATGCWVWPSWGTIYVIDTCPLIVPTHRHFVTTDTLVSTLTLSGVYRDTVVFTTGFVVNKDSIVWGNEYVDTVFVNDSNFVFHVCTCTPHADSVVYWNDTVVHDLAVVSHYYLHDTISCADTNVFTVRTFVGLDTVHVSPISYLTIHDSILLDTSKIYLDTVVPIVSIQTDSLFQNIATTTVLNHCSGLLIDSVYSVFFDTVQTSSIDTINYATLSDTVSCINHVTLGFYYDSTYHNLIFLPLIVTMDTSVLPGGGCYVRADTMSVLDSTYEVFYLERNFNIRINSCTGVALDTVITTNVTGIIGPVSVWDTTHHLSDVVYCSTDTSSLVIPLATILDSSLIGSDYYINHDTLNLSMGGSIRYVVTTDSGLSYTYLFDSVHIYHHYKIVTSACTGSVLDCWIYSTTTDTSVEWIGGDMTHLGVRRDTVWCGYDSVRSTVSYAYLDTTYTMTVPFAIHDTVAVATDFVVMSDTGSVVYYGVDTVYHTDSIMTVVNACNGVYLYNYLLGGHSVLSATVLLSDSVHHYYTDTLSPLGLVKTETSPIILYPNPAHDFVIIKITEPCSVELYDNWGQQIPVVVEKIGEGVLLKLNELASSTYFVKVTTNTKIFTARFVKD